MSASTATLLLLALLAATPAGSMDAALRGFMEDSVVYSTPSVVARYEQGAVFRPRGMGHLYNATDCFMRLIQRKDPLPEGVLTVDPESQKLQFQYAGPYWRMVFTHNVGLVAVLGGAVVLALVLVASGLVFCCCRCSGRCGARWQPFDKKHDRCRRVTLGVLLSLVAVLILFGMVCAFSTNEFMQQATDDLPHEAGVAINNSVAFLENTKQEVNNLLLTNYKQLEDVLNQALDTSGEMVSQQLAEVSNATSLQSLTTLVTSLEDIRHDLEDISNLTTSLEAGAQQLSKELAGTREGLLEHLRKCSAAVSCQTMLRNYNISQQLNTDADFNNLPDISAQLREMSSYSDVPAGVGRGRSQLQRLQTDIQASVDSNSAEIKRSLHAAGQGLARIDADMRRLLEAARRNVTDQRVADALQRGQEALKHYAPFRYYIYMGMNCMLLLIFTCLTMGLFYGFCGRRPDGHYSNDCCNKATGAKFLMIAVWLVLVFGAVMVLLVAIMFAVGLVSDRAVCQPLRQPSDSQVMRLVDQLLDIGQVGAYPPGKQPDISVSQLIVSCHANSSLYTVLGLESVFNISQVMDYEETYHIREKLTELRRNMRYDEPVQLLDARTRLELDKLAAARLDDIDFPQYTAVLARKVVGIDLMEFARALNKTAIDIQMNPRVDISIPKYFRAQAKVLEALQRRTVSGMQRQVTRLDEKASDLERHLTFENSSLSESVQAVVQELQEAQVVLDQRMATAREEVSEFTERFLHHVNHYLLRVVSETQQNMGRCGPISAIYNTTLVATCDNFLRPFNGFWASFGWCLLLFLPMMVLSVKLASLYQKSDKYPGPQLNDTEHLYDAYADHDNIPLANVHDKKNHHRSYHDTSGGSTGGGSAYLGGSGAPPPARYSDMAPKHWDYPGAVAPGGSPRYHSPPLATEYERPPPYYYPGPGEPNQR